MDFGIRHVKQDEWHLLEDFLYEVIFVPEDYQGEVPRSVIYDDPKCRAAFERFGALPDDRAVVVVFDGSVVLESSAPAEQFYRNRGYQDVSEGMWEIESEGALPAATLTYKIMEKRLG